MNKHAILVFLITLLFSCLSNAATLIPNIDKIEKECEAGNTSKCAQAADDYETGKGVRKNIKRASELWSLACSQGHSYSCFKSGLQTLKKTSNLELATPFFKKACAYGDLIGCLYIDATTGNAQPSINLSGTTTALINSCIKGSGLDCYKVGKKYQTGKDSKQNAVQAIHFFKEGCEKKFDKACAEVAAAFEKGYGVTQSSDNAMRYVNKICRPTTLFTECAFILKSADFNYSKFMSKACLSGNGEACYKIGFAAYLAVNQPEVRQLATRYYEMACSVGNRFGCSEAAKFYLFGVTVPQNVARSRSLLNLACAQGVKSSCIRDTVNLSDPENPNYVKSCHGINTADCLKLYEACEENNFEACYLFAAGVEDNAHVTNDAHAAIAPFQKACDGGNIKACRELAKLHTRGWGTEKNSDNAIKIIRHACDKGDIRSCDEFLQIYSNSDANKLTIETVISYMARACTYGKRCSPHIPEKYETSIKEKWQKKLKEICLGQQVLSACRQFTRSSNLNYIIFSSKECNNGAYFLCEQVAQELIQHNATCKNNDKYACKKLNEYQDFIESRELTSKLDLDAEIEENFTKSCIGGYQQACFHISQKVPTFKIAVPNRNKDKEECLQHNLTACFKLSVQQNKPLIQVLEDRCVNGDLQACYDFAFAIKAGEGSDKYKIWNTFMEKGCQKNHGDSCYQIYKRTKNKKVKYKKLEKACDLGSSLACKYLIARGEKLAVY